MTLQESHVLRRLDETVYAGRTAEIETQYGAVTVHATRHHGYCAEFVDINGWKRHVFGASPVAAFLRMADLINADA